MQKPFHLFRNALILSALLSCDFAHGQEEGLASYYHSRFHGRKSSSGRVHDKNEFVAAHRTYPFGTFLRVTNLDNMKYVIVCVTDRGPRSRRRLIDLSEAAARELDFIKKGITRVRIEEVPCGLDLRYLDLIYPKPIYLDVDRQKPEPPYRIKIREK